MRLRTLHQPATLLTWLLLPLFAYAQPAGLSVRLGTANASLPIPVGFAPACRESERFASGIAAMTPPDSKLITCWVESGVWADLLAGRAQSAYPAMFVTHAEKLGNDWSQSQFDQLKSLAQQKLPSLLKEPGAADSVVRHQNEALAKEGIPISTELLQRRYVGIFDLRKTSFSYVIFREARVQTGGTPALSNETVAITTLLHAGNVLALTVVERGMSEQSALSARSRSTAWLDQFASANKR